MKINTTLSAVFAVAALAAASTNAMAANATGSAAATIAQPITVSETSGLNFGTLTASNAAGTIAVSTAGARSVTGGALGFGGTPSAGAFAVTGEGASAFTVTLPASATLSNGVNSMTVDGFTHDASGALVAGAAAFNVGATLNVGANQSAGAYSGTYTVTVNYN